jgi:hypothetical protein
MEKDSLIKIDKISKQRLNTVDLADTDNLIFRIVPKETNISIGKRRLPYYIADKVCKKFGLDMKIFESILLDRKMFNPNNLVNHISNTLKDPKIIEFVESEITNHLDDEGKPHGPTDNSWFSNIDENRVFEQVEQWCPNFYYHKACMSDFMINYEEINPAKAQAIEHAGMNPNCESLALMEPIEYKNQGKNCMGCIINTDTKPGNGIHWVSIFYDIRPGKEFHTIEYFNSTGNAPKKCISDWMQQFADLSTQQLGFKCKPVTVSNVSHQNSRSECGAYSAYFLIARIIGIDYKNFRKNKIPDEVVYEFRKCIFKK